MQAEGNSGAVKIAKKLLPLRLNVYQVMASNTLANNNDVYTLTQKLMDWIELEGSSSNDTTCSSDL